MNLLGEMTKDNYILLLLLENNSNKKKKIYVEIRSKGYISYNGYKYTCVLKALETRFLFPLALDKDHIDEYKDTGVNIDYRIVCEDV